MWSNLLICYELNSEQNKTQLESAIQSLGNSTRLLNNTWYVNSQFDADQAIKHLGRVATRDDALFIADTTHDKCAWFNLSDSLATRVRQNWKLNKAVETANQ